MQHSIDRLSRMASAMFELSVGRHVKRHPELKQGDIRTCVEQALHEVAPFADEKSLAITPDLEPCGEGLYFESRANRAGLDQYLGQCLQVHSQSRFDRDSRVPVFLGAPACGCVCSSRSRTALEQSPPTQQLPRRYLRFRSANSGAAPQPHFRGVHVLFRRPRPFRRRTRPGNLQNDHHTTQWPGVGRESTGRAVVLDRSPDPAC